MKTKHNPTPNNFKFTLIVAFIFYLLFGSTNSFAQADLMVRDCYDDEISPGVEPSSCATAIYASDGIKIAQDPDPNYSSLPFTTGAGDVWSLIPDGIDAEYRDPAVYSKPNWIYVKVSNKSTAASASAGTEILRVYWAKGSTGLTWPLMWEDYLSAPIGCPTMLLGEEVTKTRNNVATVSTAERDKLIHA